MRKIFFVRMIVLIAGMFCSITLVHAQVRVGDNLGNHKATQAVDANNNNILNVGAFTQSIPTELSLAASGPIGTAAATVNVNSVFKIKATAAALTFTLPTPGYATASTITVYNSGSNDFTMYGLTVKTGTTAAFFYNGTGWTNANGNGLNTTLNSGNILVGNASNVAAAVTPTGDVTITNAGLTAIGTGKVTTTQILDNTIADADVYANAAIAGTKISPAFGTQNISQTGATTLTTGTGAVTLNGATTISGSNAFTTGTGVVSINGDATMAATKTLYIAGSTSGTIGIKGSGTVTSYSLALPAAQGGNGLTLINNGSGTLSWGTPTVALTVATPVDATDAKGATYLSGTLTLENATPSYPGIVTTGAQTFSGTKSFDIIKTTNNSNGTNIYIGDDAVLGDINATNTMSLIGLSSGTKQTAGYIAYGTGNKKFGYDGTTFTSDDDIVPTTGSSYALGSSSHPWSTTYSNKVNSGTSTNLILNSTSGNGYLQYTGTDAYSWNTTNFYPATDNSSSLGSSTNSWKTLWAHNVFNPTGYLSLGAISSGSGLETLNITSGSVSGGGTSGRVGIGTSSPNYPLDVETYLNATTVLTPYGYLNSTNGATSQTNTSSQLTSVPVSAYFGQRVWATEFDALSDEREKENIATLNDSAAYDAVKSIRAASYNWADPNKEKRPKLGFIAQEVEKKVGEAVTPHQGKVYDKNVGKVVEVKDKRVLDYNSMTAVTWAATRKLIQKVESLETENTSLKSENEELKTRLSAIEAKLGLSK